MLWRLLFRGNPDAPPRSMDLLTEIDLQNYENISLLLSTSSFSSYNKNYLQQCIRLALSSHNILIIELVLSSISSSVNSEFLSTLFTEYASDGTLPHIIYFLQQYLSPSELAYHHRQRIKFRQYHHDVSFYVVDPLEPPQLNELKQKLLKNDPKKDSYLSYLRKLRTVNDFFIDAALGDRRYTIHQLLTSREYMSPNITIINEAFVAVCRRGNYVLATILAEFISQQAFDEAFFTSLDDSETETVEWLLSGRLGFHPSQERLEVEYRKIKLSLMNHPRMRFDRGRMIVQNRPNLKNLSMIESRMSAVTKEAVENEIRAIQRAEQRRNNQRQMFHIHDADIHSYSASAIDADESSKLSEAVLLPREDAEEQLDEEVLEFLRPRRVGGKPSLNEAVIAHITRRFSQLPSDDIERTMSELVALIRHYIPSDQQEAAIRLLGEILNTRSAKLFAITLEFLKSYGPSSNRVIETWIQGFLSESVVMHSCNPGALERVVTGLRGINDPELDKIFSQAEAPQLINIFLKSTFNLFYDEHNLEAKEKAIRNSERLAFELIQRGLSDVNDCNEVQMKLVEFAHETISTYDPNIEKYKNEVLVIIEIVIDNYETHLKDYVIKYQQQQQQQQQQQYEECKGEIS